MTPNQSIEQVLIIAITIISMAAFAALSIYRATRRCRDWREIGRRVRGCQAGVETRSDEVRDANRMAIAQSAVESVTEPVVGARAWIVKEMGDQRILQSLHMRTTLWQPGRAITGRPYAEGELVDGGSQEGVYAFKSRTHLQVYVERLKTALDSEKERDAIVTGTVALGGNIVEHELGYRAEYGYPISINVNDPETAHLLRRTYGCETNSTSTKEIEITEDSHTHK